MLDCLTRINKYTGHEKVRFDGSHLVQDAVIRNLQILAESSQRLSADIKAREAQIPWRELSGAVYDFIGSEHRRAPRTKCAAGISVWGCARITPAM
jgi:uncharacterized protein with HEPN domain